MRTAAEPLVRPLHPRLAHDPAQPWRRRADWAVAPRLDHPDAAQANALALADLEGGADALTLVGAASPCARGFGLPEPAMLAAALEGVELDLVALRLDTGAEAPAFAESLAGLVASRRLGSAGLVVDLGYDPVALLAHHGETQPLDGLPRVLAAAKSAGLSGCPLLADARVWHEAGAEPAQELGLVVATAVAQWRALAAHGVSLDAARRAVAVLLPFDADVLVGLAKARAVRRLWARLEAACGLEPTPLRLHAETSWRMMTRHDPWSNAMRATAAVFAAGLGSADAVTALPMTLAIGLPDAAARRLARNTDRVLLDESGLGEVDDVAAGSGAVEAATDALCREAWGIFQDVERRGGVSEVLRGGTLAADIAAAAADRRAEVATLARGIVGTSRFPALGTPEPGVLDVPPSPGTSPDNGFPSRRDAECFERLRDRAGRAAPRAFLATLGAPATFGRSAALAGHLLAAAGVASDAAASARDLEGTLAAFRESGSPVACLCGDAAAYAAEGSKTAAALKTSGATLVLAADGTVGGAVSLLPRGESVLPTLSETLAAFGL